MALGYHAARLYVVREVEESLDKLTTKLLVDLTGNGEMSLDDRLELVEAVPSVIGDLSDKLNWLNNYHTEGLRKEREDQT